MKYSKLYYDRGTQKKCGTAVSAVVALFGIFASTSLGQSGGDYEVIKSTISSGSGMVAGADYELSGTTGQYDVTPISGGEYEVIGGYWAPVALPPDPTVDPSEEAKVRFVSFSVPSKAGGETALRVGLITLHHVNPPYTGGPSVPFTSLEGQVRWVGPPVQYVESSASQTPFYASSLQCDPHYQDWSTVGLLHVTGSAIVPSSQYEVENVAASCMGVEDTCTAVSAPLVVSTTRWGDVEVPYNPPDPTAQPNASDIGALVNKFRGAAGAPIKARALLTGSDQFGNISIAADFSFIHIASCVDAFRGLPYPFTIQACP